MISDVDQKTKQWVTQILYFSSLWFKQLEQQISDPERAVAAMELFSYFQKKSWSTLARVRYNDDQLTDALTEWGGNSSAARCKAAYLMMRHSLQVLSQRRPCFGPVSSYPELGPLDILSQELLQVARLNRTVLGPRYLHAEETGFLSLSQLIPSAFHQHPEDDLEDIFKIISRARKAALRHKVVVPGLNNLPQLFSHLAFRVRSGRRRREGWHGSVLTFQVVWLPPDAVTFRREDIPFRAFYGPNFSEDDLPPPDSRFFRVAMAGGR